MNQLIHFTIGEKGIELRPLHYETICLFSSSLPFLTKLMMKSLLIWYAFHITKTGNTPCKGKLRYHAMNTSTLHGKSFVVHQEIPTLLIWSPLTQKSCCFDQLERQWVMSSTLCVGQMSPQYRMPSDVGQGKSISFDVALARLHPKPHPPAIPRIICFTDLRGRA